jgi:long-chain acyl-CoA synthetase
VSCWRAARRSSRGYWNNEAATREVIDADGWFHTGDLAEFDAKGRVRITGRAKDLIITAGGKNVSPAALEDPLRAHPLISDSVVVGDNRPYIAALVGLDPEGLAEWAEDKGKAGRTADGAARRPGPAGGTRRGRRRRERDGLPGRTDPPLHDPAAGPVDRQW